MKKKKPLGAMIVESNSEPSSPTSGFTLAMAKHYESSQWAGKCLSCGALYAVGAPFTWYASGITTCMACYDAGKVPNPIMVAEKIAKQSKAPKKFYKPKATHHITSAVNKVAAGGGADAFSTLIAAVGAITTCECGEPDCETCADAALAATIVETQKVRGLRVLRDLQAFPVPTFYVLPGDDHEAKQYVAGLLTQGRKPFVRPCPIVPKHGFIDSRPVDSWSEALAVMEEARAVDPQAQLLVMPMLDGETSAVLTSSMLGLGAGHDSVTGAKGAYSMPVSVVFPQSWLDKAGVPKDGAPYLEIVDGYAVQLRAGDVPPKSLDFVPYDVKVSHAIVVNAESHPDLVAFDLLVKKWGEQHAGATTRPVIWHKGGSPASHYAVHMRIHGVPYLVTREPIAGESIAKTSDVIDVEAFKVQFLDGAASDLRPLGSDRKAIAGMLAAGILTVHQATDMLTTADGARLVGAGIAALFYATMAACHGETRHCKKLALKGKLAREQIYEGAWSNPLDARRTLPNALALFSDSTLWSASFGGKAWATATAAALVLWDRIVDAGRNGGTVADVLSAAHVLVNLAHNTGWLLNKFLDKTLFDTMAAARPEPFVSLADTHGNKHATSAILYRMVSNPARLPLDWSKMRQGRWKHSATRLAKAKGKTKSESTPKVKATKAPAITAQCNLKTGFAHIQYAWKDEKYQTLDVAVAGTPAENTIKRGLAHPGTVPSMAGSATPYVVLATEPVPGDPMSVNIMVGDTKIATVTYFG